MNATLGSVGTVESMTTTAATGLNIPEKLSPSRAKTFMQCPKRFYYESILGLTTPQTLATAKGTLAHHAFERIFDHAREERTVDRAVAYIRPAWSMMINPVVPRESVVEGTPEFGLRSTNQGFTEDHEPGSKSEQRLLDSAKSYLDLFPTGDTAAIDAFLAETEDSVRGWFSMENPTKFDPHERELYLMAKIAGVTVHGFIDRLDRIEGSKGVRWFVSDYKTGRPPKPQYADEAFFQLAVYALLVEEQMWVRVDQLRLLYVREGRPDAVLARPVTDQMLDATKKKLSAVSQGIKRAARLGEWEAKRNALCNWCPFMPVCPAHVPGLEGLLPEEVAARTGTSLKG